MTIFTWLCVGAVSLVTSILVVILFDRRENFVAFLLIVLALTFNWLIVVGSAGS